ncbi:MAG: hypothetical protein FWE91_07130 [Defluviitaleaceae bacterium]|nr:hypothetical protein [Defluviitaleaceae bacterium]MCL2836573.1 hypothetical protein [Defluviitaleaceae bacterium]
MQSWINLPDNDTYVFDSEIWNPNLLPLTMQDWLGELALLRSLPFCYLVPDERLLPPESMRFFFLDRPWIDAMVNGAVSVGRVSENDARTDGHLAAGNLDVAFSAVRGYRPSRMHKNHLKKLPESRTFRNTVLSITGFLLRSRIVRFMNGLEVQGFAKDASGEDVPADLMRMEPLSNDILLCLFDGEVSRVRIKEPVEGMRFGGKRHENGERYILARDIKEPKVGEVLGEIPLKVSGSGRLDIADLKEKLSAKLMDADLNSAHMAFELLAAPEIFEVTRKGGTAFERSIRTD